MSYPFPPDLDQLVQKHMASGAYHSEEELLLVALRSLEDEQSEWAAIEVSLQALDQRQQGVSLEDGFDLVRQRHSIPPDA